MSRDFEQLFGDGIGHGAQATVYAKGEYAVKLYREGYPKRNVFSEAFIMANVELVNFPGPRIYEVLLVDGRYGLRMDRVKGTPMAEELDDLRRARDILDRLVDLQCRLRKYETAGLPDLKQEMQHDLGHNDELTADLNKNLLGKLSELPGGQAFCHCDFHAGNVFLDGTKYTIVVDLLQIRQGDPARMPRVRIQRTAANIAILPSII